MDDLLPSSSSSPLQVVDRQGRGKFGYRQVFPQGTSFIDREIRKNLMVMDAHRTGGFSDFCQHPGSPG